MKLHYAGASPYARKVRAVAHELGLLDDIALIAHAVTPVAPTDSLIKDNPLGKIPALVLDDGTVLFDSRVICEHLNERGSGHLLPREPQARLRARILEAQGDGMNDALVITRYETFLRPERLRWQEWIDNQLEKAVRSMDRLEQTIEDLSTISIGSIAVACALDYADFRFAGLNWRAKRPNLAAWQSEMAARPSMVETKPV